jgi:NAD(P)-dependent dehydrogenase (short-subunit alcohol dehydrogenase family)
MKARGLPVVLQLVLVATCTATFAQAPAPAPAPAGENAQKAVLVTGASTGIGRNLTERLAAEGYFVYAGARKDSDLAALDAIDNVRAVRLDVTRDEDIAAAVDIISNAGRGLHGLVNNAGVAVSGPMMQLSDDDFHYVMNVNVYGPFRVTKAFAPLIIASKGRITTISSISGILSSPTLGVYSMSKHAIEAFGDSLAGELAPLGVHVSLIEPGNFRSEIGHTAARRTGVDSPLADRSRYPEPDAVSDAALHALFDDSPRRRYMVVPAQIEAEWTIRKAIQELVQLNFHHAHAYDRDTLVEMLDEEIAR